jgi:hypothetical protein
VVLCEEDGVEEVNLRRGEKEGTGEEHDDEVGEAEDEWDRGDESWANKNEWYRIS